MSKKTSLQQAKRVKVTLACTVCRKKKVKCDGVQPSCSRCLSVGIACSYPNLPRKRGPPKASVEVIENRAHRIALLLNNETARKKPSAGTVTRNTLLGLLSGAVQSLQSKKKKTPGSYTNYQDESNTERTLVWANHFFAYFNLFFPILSRHHFLHQLIHNQKNTSPLLLYAVYAVGCWYADESETAKMFFDRSHSILSSHVPPSLPTAQALVILCWYSYLTGDMKTTTDLRRRLVLCVKELELSRDPEPTLGIVLMELHRRAYWVIYVTEQWLASCTGEQLLPVSYDCQWPQLEDSQLYVIDDIENKLTFQDAVEYALQLHTFAEMIKLARILETRSKASLTEWLLSLPSYLEYGKLTQVPSAVARIYHILYFTVQILISCEQQQQPHNNTCTAANTIVYIAEQMLNDHQEKYLYKTFLISLTLAATVHLDNTLLCYDQAELNLSKTVHVLRKTNNSLLNSTDLDHVLHQFLGNSGGVLLVEPERNPNKRSIEETDATTNIIQPSSIEMADFFFSDNDFNPSTLMLGSLPLPSPPISCDSFTIPVDNPCVSDSSSNCYISPRPSPTLEKDNLLLSLALTDTFFPEEYINI